MPILIDGYNLLFAAGFATPPGWQAKVSRTAYGDNAGGAGQLEQGRVSLLQFLARRLTEAERRETTIVFDAKRPGNRDEMEQSHAGLRVLFAVDHDEADDLIESLIQAEPVPRKLVVVSSDTRIQTAAKRRRASVVDCDAWLMHLEHERADVGHRPSAGIQPDSRLPSADPHGANSPTTPSAATNTPDVHDPDLQASDKNAAAANEALRRYGAQSSSEIERWLREFQIDGDDLDLKER